MLEFLSKQKEKKEKIEKYLDYVSGAALPRIKEGNAGYLNSLQRVFTMKGAQRYHIEIADCFVNLLDGKTAKTLCQLDERCRGYSEYFWNWNDKIDWKAERLKRTELLYLSDRQYAAVLCVGTFHSDGYCRQACVEELKEYKGGLPFLVLRLNDWVQAVRESAYESALYRISKCEIKELFAALPMLEKVKQSGRWERSQVVEIEQELRKQISLKIPDCKLWEISRYEILIKNAIYRFISNNPVLEQSQIEQLLAWERSSFGKQLLTRAVLTQFSATAEKLLQYMSDSCSVVRYLAMEHYYEQRKDAWDGLECMLMDKAGKIRDYAAYILKRHRSFDVPGFYREQLKQGNHKIALLGLGEYGTVRELDLIVPWLESQNDHLKKTALIAYGMLARDEAEEIYWSFLQKPEPILYVQAYRLIVKYHVSYGSQRLYELYLERRGTPAADYLLQLLTREPSWKRLPYLLQVCDDPCLSEWMRGHVFYGICHRSMYGCVTGQEADTIKNLLEEKRSCLPPKTEENILWDLKFVTR